MWSNNTETEDANWLSAEQGQEISLLALQKGVALERLVRLTQRTSVNIRDLRYALYKLKAFAFGDEHPITMISDDIGTFRFTQNQLRLIRQEQLVLLAENERLMAELQEIRKHKFTNPKSGGDPPFILKEHRKSRLVKAIDKALSGENEIHSFHTKLLHLCSLVQKVKSRLLHSAFLSLYKSSNYNNAKHPRIPQRILSHSTRAACIILEPKLSRKYREQLSWSFKLLHDNHHQR